MISQIMNQAINAGHNALRSNVPNPMIVSGQGQNYYVSEGACGFAWINVYKYEGKTIRVNSKIGKELKMNGFRKSYNGAWQYWVSDGGQSVSRKEAYANAFANVLKQYGFEAYADSRLD
jgi:hypothetical protein